MNSEEHIEKSLLEIKEIFKLAAKHIDELKPGERIPATELARLVGSEFLKTGSEVYPILLFLFKDYPNTKIQKGAYGGIVKLKDKNE
jgi:hypothetical protein